MKLKKLIFFFSRIGFDPVVNWLLSRPMRDVYQVSASNRENELCSSLTIFLPKHRLILIGRSTRQGDVHLVVHAGQNLQDQNCKNTWRESLNLQRCWKKQNMESRHQAETNRCLWAARCGRVDLQSGRRRKWSKEPVGTRRSSESEKEKLVQKS